MSIDLIEMLILSEKPIFVIQKFEFDSTWTFENKYSA